MNSDETKKILRVLQVNYPQSYSRTDAEDAELLASLWYNAFKSVPYAIVRQTVVQMITDSDREFAPNVGQVMTEVRKSVSMYNPTEQWENVCYITRYVSEGIGRTLDRTADDVTKQIVSSQDIQRWKNQNGALDRERPRFFERYKELAQQKESEAIKSGNIMQIASKDKLKLLGITPNAEALIEHKENAGG